MDATRSGLRRMVVAGSRLASRNASRLRLESATTPTDDNAVGFSSGDGEIDLDAIGIELNDALLALRGAKPSATGDGYTDCTRRDMTRSGFLASKAVKQVLSQLMAAMLDPKVPDIRVKGWLETVWQVLRLRKREIQNEGIDTPSDIPLMLRAMRSEAADNEAEARFLAEPNVDRLKARIQTLGNEIADDQRLHDALCQRYARLTIEAAK